MFHREFVYHSTVKTDQRLEMYTSHDWISAVVQFLWVPCSQYCEAYSKWAVPSNKLNI